MAISSATRSLAEDIEASHATRIAGISDIVQETHQNLDNFKRTHQERADTLRSELSSSERERTQEFATFMGEIKDEIATLEHDTNQMLTDFRHNLQEQTEALRSDLSSAERERRQEFATFQRNLREQLAHTVADIAADHRQARAQWERLRTTRRTAKQVMH
jgi:hypothetical protein